MTVEAKAYPRAPFRRRVAVWLRLWAEAIDPKDAAPSAHSGLRLIFYPDGKRDGYQAYQVRSMKGSILMGFIGWEKQWRQPKFSPTNTAVFDRQSVSEVYAALRKFPQ